MMKTGFSLLCDASQTHATAYNSEERKALKLEGLLPPIPVTLEMQAQAALETMRACDTLYQKALFLQSIHASNETLFFHLLVHHVSEVLPIAYTPAVAEICLNYSHCWRFPKGMFLCWEDRGRIAEILANAPQQQVDMIVMTDGNRILGLGDLGINGMAIPAGKLGLYTAFAGVHPSRTLPITIDVGTDNEKYLSDPLYLGHRHHRIKGQDYFDFMEEVISAIKNRWPGVVIQFEDFGNANAFALLDQFRHRYCCFSDDIQGTGSIVVAGLISAAKAKGTKLSDERVLFFGAGEAGTGSADQLAVAMNVLDNTPIEEARNKMFLFDIDGLVTTHRTVPAPGHAPYAKDMEPDKDLVSCIRKIRPTTLVGLSTVGGAFTEEVLRVMGEINERPVIFPLSNPNSKSECTPHDAYFATGGRALVATGSPFPQEIFDGKTIVPRQGNNAYIYPAVGLAGLLGRLPSIEDEDLLIASLTVADMVTEEDLACGALYPPFERVREVCRNIAANIIINAKAKGRCTLDLPEDVKGWAQAQMYEPLYK